MTANKMTPANCKKIRVALNMALEDIGKDLGLTITVGNGSYDDSSVTFKTECVLAGVDKAKEEFERDCRYFHIKPEAYGTSFTYGGKWYTLVGLKTNRPKYPVLAKRDGNNYKLPRKAIEALQDIPKAEIKDFVPRTA